ncbi:MAG: Gfo/Idh/MocA family oxidoreductase [Verrucomicrobiae bacterium]|jgi:predicted dehydrogenase|nr:Gfo/Idh/MocA family oxidoreductase [Verrucomicrobiae bacterium]
MNTDKNAKSSSSTRRSFIKKSGTVAAAAAATGFIKTPVYGQSQAPSANVQGANERILVGHIGVGGQGGRHVRLTQKNRVANNVQSVAVCDVSTFRIDMHKDIVKKDGQNANVKGYKDYRDLLEKEKDIDAIFVGTVDHWHTKCSIAALEAGKHVYCEKPMTRYLGEAFEIYDAVKKTGKKFQVGAQGGSDLKWHEAARLIKAGEIGKPVMLQGSYMRNNPKGEWNYDIKTWATAEDIDWKKWIAPIHNKIPFNADHYFRWRKYQPYCGGLLGDLMPHKLHPYMLATGNPEFPKRVACVGSIPCNTDRNTPNTPPRDVPEITQLIAEFPSGIIMHISSSSVNEVGSQELIRGQEASLEMAGNSVRLTPTRPFADEIDEYTSKNFDHETVDAHHADWYTSIRTGKEPNCNIDLAIRVQTVISMAEMSERMNVMCLFDEKSRKITDGTGREIVMTYGTLPKS